MKKYPPNRIQLVEKAIIAKMLSLVLIESNDYEQALKQCVFHFNGLYHKDPDKIYGVLVSDYVASRAFAEYVGNLPGFTKFLKSVENIESFKSLTTTEEKSEIMPTEQNNEIGQNIFKKLNFQNDCLKAMKFFIDKKGKTFDESIEASHKAFAKKEGFEKATKEDVVFAIANKCFKSIQSMQKEPFKNILFLVKLLTPEEVSELKSKL
jgi:hypothetical protein